jgi:hypothetical protein
MGGTLYDVYSFNQSIFNFTVYGSIDGTGTLDEPR